MNNNNNSHVVDTEKLIDTFFNFINNAMINEAITTRISNSSFTNEEQQQITIQKETPQSIEVRQDFPTTIPSIVQHNNYFANQSTKKNRKKNKLDWKDEMAKMLAKRNNEDENFVIRQIVATPPKQKPYSIFKFSTFAKRKKKKIPGCSSNDEQQMSSSTCQQPIENIPPVVADIYGMSNTSITSFVPNLSDEFSTVTQCVAYWDLKDFKLLRFSDNLVHFVGRSKEELMQSNITYMDCLPPSLQEIGQNALHALANKKVKQLNANGIFYRKSDNYNVLTYANVQVVPQDGYIYVRSTMQLKSGDSFQLEGEEFSLEQQINQKDIPIKDRDKETTKFINSLMRNVIDKVYKDKL